MYSPHLTSHLIFPYPGFNTTRYSLSTAFTSYSFYSLCHSVLLFPLAVSVSPFPVSPVATLHMLVCVLILLSLPSPSLSCLYVRVFLSSLCLPFGSVNPLSTRPFFFSIFSPFEFYLALHFSLINCFSFSLCVFYIYIFLVHPTLVFLLIILMLLLSFHLCCKSCIILISLYLLLLTPHRLSFHSKLIFNLKLLSLALPNFLSSRIPVLSISLPVLSCISLIILLHSLPFSLPHFLNSYLSLTQFGFPYLIFPSFTSSLPLSFIRASFLSVFLQFSSLLVLVPSDLLFSLLPSYYSPCFFSL